MTFDIDPRFSASRTKAKTRRRKRVTARIGGVVVVLALLVLGFLFWPDNAPVQQTEIAADDAFVLIQTDDDIAATSPRSAAPAAFLHLRRDPMILRFEAGARSPARRLPGPEDFLPTRAGLHTPDRLTVVRDNLFVSEARLMVTLPSSRDDFAFFQSQRSAALAETDNQQMVPVEAGEIVRVADDGSFGTLISNDADGGDGAAGVFVQTRVENNTSVVLARREDMRAPLFEDEIIVLRAERRIADILRGVGFSAETSDQITQAAIREITAPEVLPTGSIVALRLVRETTGPRLLQMSLYDADGYLATLAQTGAGRFAPAADPWLGHNLLTQAGQVRQSTQATAQDIRLIDAIYSAAIRNGLSTRLVGEMIVILSQRFDLERFVADGDEIVMVYATDPGPEGLGVGQILYIGIEGPSGDIHCYVTEADMISGFECFDFDRTSAVAAGGRAGQLGGGLIIPVEGVRVSGFGPRHHPILRQVRNHNGVDWAAPTGTPILAAAPGTISVIGDDAGYGNVIYIDHPDGLQTRYAHMDRFAENLARGTQVAAGTHIGYVGTTGQSTGPHLHFELLVNGTHVDPMTFGSSGAGAAVEALVDQIIRVESAGDAHAMNPRSTATGLGQFIESTWLRMLRDYRPDLFTTMSRDQLLDLRFDPSLSREMVTSLARENESFLRSNGHQTTPGRLYLAHFLGPAGANTALSADPDATVAQVMGAAVVNANPFLRDWVVADLLVWADRKMTGTGSTTVAAAASRPVSIPPEISAFRDAIDGMLAEL
ncbi:MAG: peptidoglycan DD-metalloendopeptidase family protein [Loktanella sp.]|nr:peptidoglycan DD-metalloendopeptidase family protein [Loktanella sp.]